MTSLCTDLASLMNDLFELVVKSEVLGENRTAYGLCYLFWCQSFGDVSLYVCSLYF